MRLMLRPAASTPRAADVFPGDATEGATRAGRAPAPARASATNHPWRVLMTLSALMAFGPIATDFYLPALPAMGQDLRTDAGTIELTVTGYLVGFSLGQLLWGPISDRYGRRLPVACGILLFLVGAIGCALAPSAPEMIAFRVVQALGSCAGIVLARAMVRDLYAGDRAAQMLSTLITVMALAPLVAPLVGGQVLLFAGWRAIFWTLVGVGLLTLAAVLKLPETLPTARRNPVPLGQALGGYGRLLRDSRLIAYAAAGGFFYIGIFAYIAGTPFAYIDYYRVPAQQYGLLFGASIVGIILVNIANTRLVRRLGGHRLLVGAALATAIIGLLTLLTAWTDAGGLLGLALPLILYCSASGFIVANSIAGALDAYPAQAGAVSALIGAIHYGSGVIGSALVSGFADGTPRPLGGVMALAGVGCALCALLVRAPNLPVAPGQTVQR